MTEEEKKENPKVQAETSVEAKKPAENTEDAHKQVTAADIMSEGDEVVVKPSVTSSKKRALRSPIGIAFIRATFNNTIVTITDSTGATITWSSAGKAGFKGSRKSTAYAATMVGQDAARQALLKGVREVEVRVQGPGAGRESAIRALQTSGLEISLIKDVTPMPHNGCRPKKRRRV